MLEARDTIKLHAEGSGAVFVDPIAERWFEDHPEMVSSYGGRVNDAGHQYLAEKSRRSSLSNSRRGPSPRRTPFEAAGIA